MFTEFAMSCRVAGKFVESALFTHLLKVNNCVSGKFEVVKTKKNILLRNTLEQIGFEVSMTTSECVCYDFSSDLINNDLIIVEK